MTPPDLRAAAYNVVADYPGGATALGPLIGKAASTLSHEVDLRYPGAKLGLHDAAKITAMREAVPGVAELTEKERATCWSYSDSAADLPLLEFAGYAVLVHPSKKLAAVGKLRDWPVLQPPRPYRTKFGDMLRVILQMFGLHPE